MDTNILACTEGLGDAAGCSQAVELLAQRDVGQPLCSDAITLADAGAADLRTPGSSPSHEHTDKTDHEPTIFLPALCAAMCGLMTINAHAKGKRGGGERAAYRSAKTGQYVRQGYAQRHRSTTVRETQR